MTISDVMLMLQPRIAIEYAAALEHGDAMDSILGQESENGRLARLLIKLGFVNERPDVSCHGFGHVTCFLWVHRVCVCAARRRPNVGGNRRSLPFEAVP
jgi:Pan3 Pseudokinase domain